MADIKKVLTDEIRRLARKEIKIEVSPLSVKIVELKKIVARQAQIIKALGSSVSQPKPPKDETGEGGEIEEKSIRLNAKGIKKIREKIGVSQKVFADLIGASLLSVSHWELGKSEPRIAYKRAIAALRGIGKRELTKLFAEKNIVVKEPKIKAEKANPDKTENGKAVESAKTEVKGKVPEATETEVK